MGARPDKVERILMKMRFYKKYQEAMIKYKFLPDVFITRDYEKPIYITIFTWTTIADTHYLRSDGDAFTHVIGVDYNAG